MIARLVAVACGACVACVAACGRVDFAELRDARPLDAAVPLVWTPEIVTGTNSMFDLYAVTPDDLYAVGDDGLFHSTGDGAWTAIPPHLASFYGLWGTGSDLYVGGNLDAFGNATILHVTGLVATPETSGIMQPINDGWSTASTNLYAVGYEGSLLHSTGDGTWTPQTSGTPNRLLRMWASSPSDLYAVGDAGTIVHSTGDGQWTPEASGTAANLIGIWGRSASDIYVVGFGGTILHSTGGGTWTPEASGVTFDLFCVLGDAARVYSGGRSDRLVTFDGSAWQAGDSVGAVTQIDSVLVAAPGSFYLAATPGLVLHGQ
jgi:hypothetical protein